MSEITLMHEDIYVYIDKVRENRQLVTGNTLMTITNDATGMVADYGKMIFTVISGNYTKITLSCNGRQLNVYEYITTNNTVEIDLRNKCGKLNGRHFLLDNYITLFDDAINTIKVTLTGSGTINCEYIHNAVINNNNDLYYCQSLNVGKTKEIHSKTNVKGRKILLKTDKKSFNWSINGLWNSEEIDKFNSDTGMICIRVIDIDGNVLDNLANCLITSVSKDSSEGGDYTYAISGECMDIF